MHSSISALLSGYSSVERFVNALVDRLERRVAHTLVVGVQRFAGRRRPQVASIVSNMAVVDLTGGIGELFFADLGAGWS